MIKVIVLELTEISPYLLSLKSIIDEDVPIMANDICRVSTLLLNDFLITQSKLDMVFNNYEWDTCETVECIWDLIGKFLTKHNIDIGICSSITIPNIHGTVILTFG